MGKFIKRKSKTTGELSLMEVPSLGGVLTRAKSLALQRAAAAETVAVATAGGGGGGSYIQLRSRRLVKPNSVKKRKEGFGINPNKSCGRGGNSSRVKVKKLGNGEESEVKEDEVDLGVEDDGGSFGENMVENEGRGRTTRETTPCNLISVPDTIRTPGSSTKPTKSSNDSKSRAQNTPPPTHIPATREMDEFFTGSERQQQKLFIEKYNFDPVNEKPLRGRYEWVKVDKKDLK